MSRFGSKKKMFLMNSGSGSVIEANPFLWYNETSYATITDNRLYQWNDLSGNNNHLYHNAGLAPVVNKNTLNGLDVVSYESENSMQTNSFTLQSQPNIYIGVRRRTNDWQAYYFDGIDSLNRNIGRREANGIRMYAGVSFNPVIDLTSFVYVIEVFVFNGSNSKYITDENGIKTGDVGSQGINGITLGASYDYEAWYRLNGDIAEFKMYNSLITDEQINLECNRLKDKWGLSWTNI